MDDNTATLQLQQLETLVTELRAAIEKHDYCNAQALALISGTLLIAGLGATCLVLMYRDPIPELKVID
jgi:hypothetical protein